MGWDGGTQLSEGNAVIPHLYQLINKAPEFLWLCFIFHLFLYNYGTHVPNNWRMGVILLMLTMMVMVVVVVVALQK